MELFAPILGMTMIVVGLIGFAASVGWLLYLIWQSGPQTPAAPPDPPVASDSGSGGLQS